MTWVIAILIGVVLWFLLRWMKFLIISWLLEFWIIGTLLWLLLEPEKFVTFTMTWPLKILIIILIIGLFVYFFLRPAKPETLRHMPIEEIDGYLWGFRQQWGDGALMMIQQEGTDHRVRFIKKVLSNDEHQVLLEFPDEPWAQPYSKGVKELFEKEGVKYIIREDLRDSNKYIILANCYDDGVIAYRLLRRIWFDVLGLDDSSKFCVWAKRGKPLPHKKIFERMGK